MKPIEQRGGPGGFTLVELMAATAILSVMLLLIFSITQQTGEAWKNSAAKIESFQGARAAFESMTRRISQATLNTYYDYYDNSTPPERRTEANKNTFVPAKYGRHSDLHFISGTNLVPGQVTHSIFFQAPTGYADDTRFKGMENTLNATGYFVEYSSDKPYRPSFLGGPEKYRFRLMQFLQPTQRLSVYDPNRNDPAAGSYLPNAWFTEPMSLPLPPDNPPNRPAWQVADNVVGLIVHPKRSQKDIEELEQRGLDAELSPAYSYDSRTPWQGTGSAQPATQHQLPPLVEVVMIAVDEASFTRFGNSSTPPNLGHANLFADPALLDDDLITFSNILNATPGEGTSINPVKLKYQVFRSEIPIRASKWSGAR